jgi:hypothetical protein
MLVEMREHRPVAVPRNGIAAVHAAVLAMALAVSLAAASCAALAAAPHQTLEPFGAI